MRALFAGVAALLLLAPLDKAYAQNAPTVTAVTFESFPKSGDTYKRGEEIRVGVTFSETVVVTGTPQYRLRMRPGWARADYDAALSDGSRLIFVYTVQTEDRNPVGDLLYDALALNNGTIKSADDMTDANLRVKYLAVSTNQPGIFRTAFKVDGSQVDSSTSAAPTALNASFVSTPADGNTYQLGEQIRVALDFDGAVAVTGTPEIFISFRSSNNPTRTATYDAPLSTGTRLVFSYTVQETDHGSVLDARGVSLGGGTIRSASDARDANIQRASFGESAYKVDGFLGVTSPTVPTVSGVEILAPENGDTFQLQERILVIVKFSPGLRLGGTWRTTPVQQIMTLALTIGDQTRQAQYRGGLGGGLGFSYRVQNVDRDMDGLSIAANALALGDGITLAHPRSANTRAELNLGRHAFSNDARYKVSGTRVSQAPRVHSVRIHQGTHYSMVPCRSVMGFGCAYDFDVNFDKEVTVTGRPQLALTIGAQTRQAYYVGQGLSPGHVNDAGGSTLVFSYAVQTSDRGPDGLIIAGTNALTLNGGTIIIKGGKTAADLDLSRIIQNYNAYGYRGTGTPVDGSRVATPRVASVELRCCQARGSGGRKTYRIGDVIPILVRFNQTVEVTGSPQLALTIGSRTRQAEYRPRRNEYLSTRSMESLNFGYRVQASDLDLDGVDIPPNGLTLNGGTITVRGGTEAANLNYTSSLIVGRHLVDGRSGNGNGGGTNPGGGGTNPGGGSNPEPRLRVSTVRWTGTPASEETYRLGEQIRVAVTFSDAVTVTGTPQIGLTVGSTTRQAAYDATRSKGTLLTFTYTVQATDADADGISIAANALTLNGSTINLASDSTTAAALGHNAVATDDTRKVDGSTDVVEHGDSREQATLLTLTARTTGEVGETGGDDGFQGNVGTARSADIAGAVEQAGDADYFRVEVPEAGSLTVETTGTTDTEGALQGATGQTLTEDDDGGTGNNFRVERQVQAGTYYVAVTGGENEQGIGLYTLSVRFTPVGGGTTVGDVVPPSGSGSPPAGSTPPDAGEPGDGAERQPAPLRLNAETTGRLEQAGEVDYFRVEVEEAGTLTVEAAGTAAPVTYFGAGDEPLLHQSAAQSASGTSREEPRGAAWPVTAGTYQVAVVGGAARTQTGAYTVAVRFTAASEAGPLQATLRNLSPAQAWVHFYCRRAQHSEAAACIAQMQCGQRDEPPVTWAVEVAPETIVSYWPGRTRADGTPDNFEAALIAASMAEADARQRTTCRVFSADPLDVRAYTRIGQDVVPVASPPAPVDAAAPTRVATLLNLAPAHARVHLSCQKTLPPDMETVDPCAVRLQCGQQEGPPVAWEVDVAAETTVSYGPGGTSDDLAAALVAAGKNEAEARRRTTCQVFSRDPVEAWAYTRIAGEVMSVANPPAPVDAVTPTRVTTLQNLAPADAWVHFYCRKPYRSDAETADPCTVRLQCGQRDGTPVAWGNGRAGDALQLLAGPDGGGRDASRLRGCAHRRRQRGGRGRAADDVSGVQYRSGGRAGLHAAGRGGGTRGEPAGLAGGRRTDAYRDVAELGTGARVGAFLLSEGVPTGCGDH